MKLKLLYSLLYRCGVVLGALTPEVDNLDTVPEFQRAWYNQDPINNKFKLDLSKVNVEDTTGLRNTVKATREEAHLAKEAADSRVREALKPFEGIDPVKTRKLLEKFASEEEREQIAAGNWDEVINKRLAKRETELNEQVTQAQEREQGALEVARTFMEKVLDGQVAAAASAAGVHASAIGDILRRAREIFDIDDNGNAVQFDEDDQLPMLGKDGKTPFSPAEWIEGMRKEAPHWFPASASGGGAGGDRGVHGRQDLTGLSPQQKLTLARTGAIK